MKIDIIRFFLKDFHSCLEAGLDKDAITARGSNRKIPAGISHSKPMQIKKNMNADLSKVSEIYFKNTSRDTATVNDAKIPPSTVRC